MKKALALLLCCVMVLTIAAGCKKNKPEELTNTRISSDLANNYAEYAYTHITGTPSISELNIAEKNQEEDRITVSVSAVAVFSNAKVKVAATMAYALSGTKWRLTDVTVSDSSITPTGAPSIESVLNELVNYVSINGGAIGVLEENEHLLQYNLRGAEWTMACEDGAKTATLNVTFTSKKLSFAGYYTLTFVEKGWVIETTERGDGRHHPLMHLTSLTRA